MSICELIAQFVLEGNVISRFPSIVNIICGLRFISSLGAIACIDAMFTQKNNKQEVRDPPRQHLDTVFIPETEVKTWENYVVQVCRCRNNQTPLSDPEDGYEENDQGQTLKVPKSVLDGCEQSFTAADGKCQKATTQFFDSTALMGILCWHDHVLWLVNMTLPGEHQHYAFCLIQKLFNLPPDFKMGILYDVGCSTHCSCMKWGFLEQYLPQITFVISVFHAYGHGWACQCIYHPWKCKGFGLSDGEGCKHCWHYLSRLVAYLCVCGVCCLSLH